MNVNAAGNSVTPVTAQGLLEMPTATIVPTATPDFRATMDIVQAAQDSNAQTSVALQSIIIWATQTKEANEVLIAQAHVQESQNKFEESAMIYQAQMTQQAFIKSQSDTAIPLTAAAYQTTIPIIQTAQVMTQQAPAAALQMAQAENERRFGWADSIALWVMVFIALVFVIVLIRFIATQGRKQPVTQYYEKPLEDLIPIPMAQKDSEPGTTQKAVIPCTWPRLEMLSKGVIQQGKTLAKNQWEGTIVHRSIDALREYFLLHEFAYELPGKRGELGILEKGNHFFMYCVENGEPPSPHVCEQLPSPTA